MLKKIVLGLVILYVLYGVYSFFWIHHQYFVAHNCADSFGGEKCNGARYCTMEFTDIDHQELYCTNSESEYLIKLAMTPNSYGMVLVWPLMWVGYGFCPPNAGSC